MKSGEEKILRVSKEEEKEGDQNPTKVDGHFMQKREYSGPIPDPQMFAEFEKVLPGSADRILGMAEEQSRHRQKIETRVVWFDGGKSILGLFLAFFVILAGIIAGTYLIINNKDTSGLIAILGPIVTVAGLFILQENKKKDEAES